MNRRTLRKIWICGDIWMDILPSFDHAQLGLKIALLSDRFDILVDAHFDGKSELTIWRTVEICEGIGPEPKLSVLIDDKWVQFPFPDCPLPNKIRFNFLWIKYIDHSVIEFLRANKHIWDRNGTKLELNVYSYGTESDSQPIWDVFTSEIWPIVTTNMHHLSIDYADNLDNLRRLISPTILTDLDQLISINSGDLFPDAIGDDGPNATSGQTLTKWVHTPSKNGQPKRLFCADFDEAVNLDWVNSFKETFLRATDSSVNYKIMFGVCKTPIEPFELVNEQTKEKLTLLALEEDVEEDSDDEYIKWLLKRCPISEKAAAIQSENDDENWENNLNTVKFNLRGLIRPLSPSTEEAGKSTGTVV